MSSPPDTCGSVNVAREAWSPIWIPCTLALAVLGSDSAGSSCFACTTVVLGWLSPNASAFRPGSARLELT